MAYKLLLADDSITIQKVVELTLSEEGFDVTAVGDGEAAFEAARKLVPDIVLADVFMPKMDGYDLCGRLKKDPALKSVPVVLLAGTFENYDEAKAAQVGADDHLTKPFESADLIAKVRMLAERAKAAPAEAPAAEAVEEAMPFEEAVEAAPAEADDLWSVVDMASKEQPLSGAKESIGEDELWKRANLLSETGETAAFPKEEEPWGGLSAEPVAGPAPDEEAESLPEVSLEEESGPEATAILNMDDLQPSAYGFSKEKPASIDIAEVAEPVEITPFENLEEATSATEYMPKASRTAEPPAAAARPAPASAAAISPDLIRQEVVRAVGDVLDKKIKEALAGISRDMIEQVVWEVVPDLAEEILVKEIEKLKAGMR